MEGPTPCLFESKKGRDGGALPPPREPLGVPRAGHPPYIFLFYVINIKRKRDGGLRVKKI